MDVVTDIRAVPKLESDELWFKDASSINFMSRHLPTATMTASAISQG